jgi:hypothetical protein
MVATLYPTNTNWVALSKLTYGFTPQELIRINNSGFKSWLDKQLSPTLSEGPSSISKLSGFKTLTATIDEVSKFSVFDKNNDLSGDELAAITLIRRLFSERQLFEMLVEHFNDYIHVPLHTAWQSRVSFDRDVIRANALGNYPDMLMASSVHPAMLEYLNGNDNTKEAPNENYGRELQELHTVTSKSGYLQSDVVDAARAFSGVYWDYDKNILVTDPDQHWMGKLAVFGWTHPNTNSDSTEILKMTQSLVHYLAMKPETAKAFSTRLARRFVADEPSPALIARMSAKYMTTGGNIPAVMRSMISSREFIGNAGKKVKRPMEHFASVIRNLELKLANPIQPGDADKPDDYFHDSVIQNIDYYLVNQGHEPMAWPFPNGYPDVATPWTTLNGQIRRWNNGAALSHGWNDQDFLRPDFEHLLKGVAVKPGDIVDALSMRLLGTKLSAADRADIVSVVSDSYDSSASLSQLTQYGQTASTLILAMPIWNFR